MKEKEWEEMVSSLINVSLLVDETAETIFH